LLLGIECAELAGRAAIERDWRALLRKRDGLPAIAWNRTVATVVSCP